ncbi:choice-of-anchor I family protein [Aquimarina hainanensis]|uniref:Choice-of-anchor I family protein n=2 Tax=Aquimarina hainanensis TaxID=1578017 RepID=A0ABW5N5G9_9FLAO
MNVLQKAIVLGAILGGAYSCIPDDHSGGGNGDPLTFTRIGGFVNGTGKEGFVEITAFDPETDKLFIVNPAASQLSVWDLSDPKSPVHLTGIPVSGTPNSVAVHDGVVAVAVENGGNPQAPGAITTYDTEDYQLLAEYTAGAMPDMVTFSPDGNYIIAANEGEPNDDYSSDPEGSVTIVEVETGMVNQVGFEGFTAESIGYDFRVFGPSATFSQDVEPEYIAVAKNSKTAYVTLQENNGIAIVDLTNKVISDIVGLGVKDHTLASNKIDASNKDNISGNFKNWPVYGIFMPDAITYTTIGGTPYLITANEGDARDYKGFSEEERVKDILLDPTVFPDAAELQKSENLGRLKITTAQGDTDGDGDYDTLYCYGGRSFTIWTTSGTLVYDSGSFIGEKTWELQPELFNNDEGKTDGRSDDKGAEPEGVEILKIGEKTLLFVGLERTGGAMVFDISNPRSPVFLEWLRETADVGPEGLVAVTAEDSPTGNDLIIISNEVSNSVSIYEIK